MGKIIRRKNTGEPEGKTEHDIREHAGYVGVFTRNAAIGAIGNGTRVRKINSEFMDAAHNGHEGAVLGSLAIPMSVPPTRNFGVVPFVYFVEWDMYPKHAIGVISPKLEIV